MQFERLAAPHYGIIDTDTLRRMTGLELLQAMGRGELPAPSMAGALNYWFHSVEPSRVVFHGEPRDGYFNPLGTVHGGWCATLLDSCMGCAVHTTLGAGIGYTTIEIKTNFVRPLGLDSGLVSAEGYVTHAGRRVALAEGRVTDGKGRLIATGSTSCLILG